ncbi:hypothetical protein LSTR_LSTR010716 [Laodelphax striatellus]|uniref:dolichol kinase n=1 Tax=Laodelphax striatellus TaxID=195883 RepID=A0A482WYE2_LAOST|nr:hypothetical protein LSTR_LSTR010716 [Laodelphax striatellus]
MDFDLVELDRRLETFINGNNLKTRRLASHGIWMSFLLPLAVIIGTIKYECSGLYRVSCCISLGLLTNSILILFQISSNFLWRAAACLVTSAVTILSLAAFSDQGPVFNVLIALLTSLGFQMLLLTVLQSFPSSFTFGEACVSVQSIVLFLAASVANFGFEESTSCVRIATLILQVGLSGVGALCILLKLYPEMQAPSQFYILSVGLLGFLVVPILHILLSRSAVLWIFYELTQDLVTVKLVFYWALCCVAAILVVIVQVSGGKKSSTIVRKAFHLLALAVFIPGLTYRPCLLYLASGVVFALFICLELLRSLKIPPLSDHLEAGFAVFADEKDEGPLALTPIYLLIGCAGPLWLHPLAIEATPPSPHHLLPMLAGLLAVGVGDTAASVCGTWFGQHHWPGSNRTKEGSAACFISQLFAVLILIHFGYIPRTSLLKPIFAIVISSLVEANTDQVDNLALPLLMYIILL